MKSLTFKKQEILEKVRKNREEHLEIVQEAQTGYREKLKKILEDRLQAVNEGREVDIHIDLVLPENYIHEYDRAITMLTMCTEDEVELDADTFDCLIMNNWVWRRQFLVSNSHYSGKAMNFLSTKKSR